jgi:hypothetical protein
VNIELIVGEIDAEIEKLKRIRAILEQLLTPKARKTAKPRRASVRPLPQLELRPEPRLVILPPKRPREYTHRAKQAVVEPKALAAPISNRPVFVPKAAVPDSQPAQTVHDASGLEALMRRKLLGGAA